MSFTFPFQPPRQGLPGTEVEVRLRVHRAAAGLLHGPLPFLSAISESDQTQASRLDDAQGHYDGDPQTVLLESGQRHEIRFGE